MKTHIFFIIQFRKIIAIAVSLFFALTVSAQTEDPQTQVETMTIFGTFTPTIKLTPKLEDNPGANDYSVKPPVLDFEMKTDAIRSVEYSDPLPMQPLPKEEQSKYLHNYLILGFGNYITPYGEFYANTSAMNNHAFGVHLKHHSSQGGIKDYAENAFSHNLGDLYYKYSGDRLTLKTDVFLQRNVVHYYGFHPTETFNPDVDSIRQRYFLGGTRVSMSGNNVDPEAFNYLAQFKYYNFSDRFQNRENAFEIGGDFSKGFYLFNTRTPQRAGSTISLNYFGNHTEIPNLYPTTTTDIQFGVQPYFSCDWSEYRLKVGADFGVMRSHAETDFYIHPLVEASIKIIQNRLYLFGRLGGEVQRNSFLALTEDNPFIASGQYSANFMNKKITAAGGFSAMISKGFDMKLGIEYATVDNMPFFMTIPNEPTHNFFVMYDKVRQTDLFLKSAYAFSDKIDLELALRYSIYQPDSLDHAYYHPNFKMTVKGSYRPMERLRVGASFNLFSRMWAFNPEVEFVDNPSSLAQYDVHIPVLYDLNLNAEYRIWKELYGFIQANNIFAQNYERYLYYPTQGFNILAGVRFRF